MFGADIKGQDQGATIGGLGAAPRCELGQAAGMARHLPKGRDRPIIAVSQTHLGLKAGDGARQT